MQRIVHLDLKGAPLKIPYLEKVLLLAKSWGATGVLLEWEDTFPYTGQLGHIGSGNNSGGDGMYSLEEIRYLLQFLEDNGLEAIQLVQTISHLEYILKHQQHRHLREVSRAPSVLCPCKSDGQVLLREMLTQVLDVQSNAKYLHIGADEVWYSAVCPDCEHKAATNPYKANSLYLEHIRDLTLFVKQLRPDLTVLIWDDMLRNIPLDVIKAYNLGDLVQPVVWHYLPKEGFNIESSLWAKYSTLFPQVWAGSAFKGANGPSQILSPVSRYVSNHTAWLQEIKQFGRDVNFAGIILTGWSRYDHYATLCELLPVSLPSLASCLKILHETNTNKEQLIKEVLPSDEWPGEELARCVHSFVVLRDRANSLINCDQVATWLNPWQIEHKYTQPMQMDAIVATAGPILQELTVLQSSMSAHLRNITGERSTEEWLNTFVKPIVCKLTELYNIAVDRAHSEASDRPV